MLQGCPKCHAFENVAKQFCNCHGPVPSMVAEKTQPNWATTLLAQMVKSGVDVAEEVRGFGVHGNVEHHGAVQTTTLAMPRVVQPANIPTGIDTGLIS